jgi:ElaB/YqjD/DUF883 family membrane-anchored ribosome-binding protein
MNENRAAGAAKTFGGKVEDSLGRTADDVRSQVEDKMKRAQEAYDRARDRVEDYTAGVVRKQASSFEKTLRSMIETRPYTVFAVALAVGWFIGRMGRSYD